MENKNSTSAVEAPPVLSLRLTPRQLTYLQEVSRWFSAAALALTLLASGALWPVTEPATVLSWALTGTGAVLLREALLTFTDKLPAAAVPTALLTLSAVCGLWWGALPVVFLPPGDAGYTMLVTVVALALLAVALAWLAAWTLQFLAFSLPAGLGLAWAALGGGGLAFSLTALAVVLFVALAGYQASRVHASLARNHALSDLNRQYTSRLQSASQEMRGMRQALQQASTTKRDFLLTAGTQVRQPINTINLLLDSLRSCESDAEREQITAHLEHAMLSLDQSFATLMDMAQLESGALAPEPQSVQLGEALAELLRSSRAVARREGLKLRTHLPDAVLRTDPALLARVMHHLVHNALQHTGTGGVLLASRVRRSEVWLEVWDTGPGIAEQDMDRVFDEFSTGERDMNSTGGGLGLGLAIVRRLCRLLDHPLQVRSRVGRGSMFRLRVPRGSPRALRDRQRPQQPGQVDLQGRTILLLDSKRAVLDALEPLLRRWGCAVWAALSYEEALSLVMMEAVVPDAIICDQQLREETGFEAIAAVRAEMLADIPALMMASDTSPETQELASNERITLLAKPVRTRQLQDALRQVCARAA